MHEDGRFVNMDTGYLVAHSPCSNKQHRSMHINNNMDIRLPKVLPTP